MAEAWHQWQTNRTPEHLVRRKRPELVTRGYLRGLALASLHHSDVRHEPGHATLFKSEILLSEVRHPRRKKRTGLGPHPTEGGGPIHGALPGVGQEFWKDSPFISRVFSALDDIPVRMISLGASDINLSLVVPQEMMHTSIKRLHKEFF